MGEICLAILSWGNTYHCNTGCSIATGPDYFKDVHTEVIARFCPKMAPKGISEHEFEKFSGGHASSPPSCSMVVFMCPPQMPFTTCARHMLLHALKSNGLAFPSCNIHSGVPHLNLSNKSSNVVVKEYIFIMM